MAGVVRGLAAITLRALRTPIAWTWYVLIGTAVTFGVGLSGVAVRRRLREPGETSRPAMDHMKDIVRELN